MYWYNCDVAEGNLLLSSGFNLRRGLVLSQFRVMIVLSLRTAPLLPGQTLGHTSQYTRAPSLLLSHAKIVNTQPAITHGA